MRLFPAIILFTITIMTGTAQDKPVYDKTLAESLGGDEYGMKQYVLVILKTGSNTTADKPTVSRLFAGHMENIGRLAAENKLVVAGPMQKNDKNYRGIFILNVPTIAEAQELLITDPAIKDKLLEAECFLWYGSAALPEYLKSHEKIQLKKH